MTIDIRNAALREAKRLRVLAHGHEYGVAANYKLGFVDGAEWGAARVTPTREQIAEAMIAANPDSGDETPTGIEMDWYLRDADAVLALIEDLASG